MRYGVISDIHSNLEALQAVLEDSEREGVDGYLCAGDIVGYGADPVECIALVRSLKPKILIAGNHEWGVLGMLDLDYFNEYAASAVIWTKNAVGKKDTGYLKSFQLVHEGGDFAMVHGTLNDPEQFRYIFDKDDAYETAGAMKAPVCFVGHSHIAGIYIYEKGKMRTAGKTKVKIDKDGKYVINVGSVGQPRDRDPRASYAIYDDAGRTVEMRRVEYDIAAARTKIVNAGLPAWLAERLTEGK